MDVMDYRGSDSGAEESGDDNYVSANESIIDGREIGLLERLTSKFGPLLTFGIEKLACILLPTSMVAFIKLMVWIYSSPMTFAFFWGVLILLALMAEAAIDFNSRYPVSQSIYAGSTTGQRAGDQSSDIVLHERDSEQESALERPTIRTYRARTIATSVWHYSSQNDDAEDVEDNETNLEPSENSSSCAVLSKMILQSRARSLPARTRTNFTMKSPEARLLNGLL